MCAHVCLRVLLVCSQVQNVVEMPEHDHMSLMDASRWATCAASILDSKCFQQRFKQ
jgi:hypothetical protein